MPVVCRIKKDAVLLDARTILDDDEIAEAARAFGEYFEEARA